MDRYLDKRYWNGLIKMSISRLFILRVLYEKPLHGYGISKRISSLTCGCCAPTEGALYPVLHEFEEGGYVTCQAKTVNGRKRKVYTITSKGEEAYRVGLEAWQETALALLEAKKELAGSGE
ncbi:MAG: PadR family transcriptional regulator [Firmicutes bacterium]|jgi:PadR family transcriptional regulator PadR|nr:PadR family transcriptional regulator [Bacillota bacterium]